MSQQSSLGVFYTEWESNQLGGDGREKFSIGAFSKADNRRCLSETSLIEAWSVTT